MRSCSVVELNAEADSFMVEFLAEISLSTSREEPSYAPLALSLAGDSETAAQSDMTEIVASDGKYAAFGSTRKCLKEGHLVLISDGASPVRDDIRGFVGWLEGDLFLLRWSSWISRELSPWEAATVL